MLWSFTCSEWTCNHVGDTPVPLERLNWGRKTPLNIGSITARVGVLDWIKRKKENQHASLCLKRIQCKSCLMLLSWPWYLHPSAKISPSSLTLFSSQRRESNWCRCPEKNKARNKALMSGLLHKLFIIKQINLVDHTLAILCWIQNLAIPNSYNLFLLDLLSAHITRSPCFTKCKHPYSIF